MIHQELDQNLLSAVEPFVQGVATTGFFSDLDGTLSEIAPTPDAAAVSPAVRRSLSAMATRFGAVGIITGRDVEEARRMLGVPDLIYIGNHGLEWLIGGRIELLPGAEAYRQAGAEVAAEVERTLSEPGILIERKRLGVAAHYRCASSQREARARILAAISPLASKYGLRRLDGRRVIELVPQLSLNKGRAIRMAIEKTGVERLLFLGDDLTDVAALKTLRELRGEGFQTLGIAVLSAEAPSGLRRAADFGLSSVAQVTRLVEYLAARTGPTGHTSD